MKKEFIKIDIDKLIPYANNPRKNDDAVLDVNESIRQVGYITPIIIDENNVILAGHTRLKALKKQGMRGGIDVLRVSELSEEEKRKYRLLDNKTNEKAEWDLKKLEEELKDLDFDNYDFGFLEISEDNGEDTDNPYTNKTAIPQYEVTGEPVALFECIDKSKTDELIREIEKSSVPDDIKEFLKVAAYRHTFFNYQKIAEYYVKADEEVQRLMEDSALVIIDIDDAIAKGYAKLKDDISDIVMNE